MAKRLTHKVWSSVLVSGCFLLAGCKKQETIQVYQVPKEKPITLAMHQHDEPAAAPSSAERPAPPVRPKLTYKVPAGWQEAPQNQVSAANFNIEGPGGQKANVSIAALPPLANREAEVVNMWRQQIGLEEVSSEKAAASLSEVEVGGAKGKMFDLGGGTNATEGMRIITAMQHEEDASWFYKISGDDALVAKEKANFLDFIKSVRFEKMSNAATSPAPAAVAPTSGSGFKWAVPPGWKEVAPGAMQQAKFQVPPQKDATAEVTVSVFPSDTGGNLANINRWRGQLKLSPVDEAGLAKLVKPLDPAIPGAILVDMENQGDRMMGAIVPRGGRWFFYKLRGGTAAVEAQKETFVAFARSEP